MAVSYKRLLHLIIERDISNAQLMREANISANIMMKIKKGQYMALDKVESICKALDCTPNDILEFTAEKSIGQEYNKICCDKSNRKGR